ncbi:MAG: hypothetical protein Q8Q48_00500 [Candidatus Staskawiczbacteria bacterium]|nr:hypothetical protein [Candidatus Staskawiczbacteria bacterium]
MKAVNILKVAAASSLVLVAMFGFSPSASAGWFGGGFPSFYFPSFSYPSYSSYSPAPTYSSNTSNTTNTTTTINGSNNTVINNYNYTTNNYYGSSTTPATTTTSSTATQYNKWGGFGYGMFGW